MCHRGGKEGQLMDTNKDMKEKCVFVCYSVHRREEKKKEKKKEGNIYRERHENNFFLNLMLFNVWNNVVEIFFKAFVMKYFHYSMNRAVSYLHLFYFDWSLVQCYNINVLRANVIL